MRYGLIFLTIALLGVGEYAFVEYYPVTPQRRVQKFKKLPVVRQFVLQQEKNLVEKAFSADEDGVLSYKSGKTTHVWNSVEEWLEQRKAGNRWAGYLADRLQFQQEAKARFSVEGGFALPVHSMDHLGYYFATTSLGDPDIVNQVLDRWRSDPTATAQWTYKMYFEKSLDVATKEGMLLTAQMSIENMEHPKIKKPFFEQQSERNQNTLDMIWSKSDAGDETAKWVTDQLSTRQINNSSAFN